MTGIVFCSFRNWNVTQKNASCFSSVYSHFGIVPKECTLSVDCFLYYFQVRCMSWTMEEKLTLTLEIMNVFWM